MSDTDYDQERRARSRVLRVTPEVDGLVRAYAEKAGCTPYEAAERLIRREEAAPCTCASTSPTDVLPADLERRIDALAARRGKDRATMINYALSVAVGRLEAVDKYAVSKRVAR